MKWLSLLCMASLIACNSKNKNQVQDVALVGKVETGAATADSKASLEASIPVAGAADTFAGGSGSAPLVMQNGGAAPLLDYDKKIIKTGHMRVEVKNFQQYNATLRKSVKAFGAYVAQEDQQENSYSIRNNMTIKVPVAQFDDLMNELAMADGKVVERKVSSDDVSMEVVDTKGRIEARKQMRAKYFELLKDAHKMDDILSIQNEINTIQENLESADGRLQYLQHSAAFSTINIEVAQILKPEEDQDAQPGFIGQIGTALGSGAKVVKELALALITIWPFLILVAGIWWWFFRKKRVANGKINAQDLHNLERPV